MTGVVKVAEEFAKEDQKKQDRPDVMEHPWVKEWCQRAKGAGPFSKQNNLKKYYSAIQKYCLLGFFLQMFKK